MQDLDVKLRLWLEKDGRPVYGDGRHELLLLIDELGSISMAASRMNMSYRKAWGNVRSMEERLDVKLVQTTKGGRGGGGTVLTGKARELMGRFSRLKKELEVLVSG